MTISNTVACVTSPIFLMLLLICAPDVTGADSKAADTKVTGKKTTYQYNYNSVGKRDPFKPFFEREMGARKKLKKDISPSPLLISNIDQFRLVGISGDERIRKAIVQDAKGKVYPIRTGTYIGMSKGRVLEIRADRVIVEDKSEVRAGKARNNKITMKLRTEDLEKP